jgi:hypothetical protein
MNDSPDTAGSRRTPPGEGGWLAAKKAVAERNEAARRSAKAERSDHELRLMARQRAQRDDSIR